MNFNEIEQKLIRLGLCNSAHDGEAANAATMLFRQLRKRQISAEQFINNSGNNQFNSAYEGMYRASENARRIAEEKVRYTRNENDSLKSKVVRLSNEVTALQAVIEAAKKAGVNVNADATQSQTRTQSRTYYTRSKTGSGLLSNREREFFAAIGRKAEFRGDLSKSLHHVGHCKAEHGLIQIFIRKGLLEKRSNRGWHGLTEKGVEYYKTYCRL